MSFTDFHFWSGNETIPFYSMVGQGTALDSLFTKPKDFDKVNLSAMAKNLETIEKEKIEQSKLLEYAVTYPKKKKAVLKKIRKRFKADYLLFYNKGGQKTHSKIDFKVKNKTSFARGINIKTGRLVYVQDTFQGSSNIEAESETLIAELQKAPEIKKESLRRAGRPKAPSKDKSEQADDSDKALVAILNFYDRTDTTSYTWMSTSLADAINKSMLQVFEFNRATPDEVQKQSDAVLKGSDKVNKDVLKRLQEATGVDYVVLGKYTYSAATKKITVTAAVYDLYTYDKIGEALAKTETDVRLFGSVDTVAQKIVKDIFKFAASQDQSDGKKAAPRQFIVIKRGLIKGDAAKMSIDAQADAIEFDRYNLDFIKLRTQKKGDSK